tara:strand:+ start:1001 stop:1291 length:291 start_codon:yes stop_codon:yes gene_type:complete
MNYVTEEQYLEASENDKITDSESELKNLIIDYVGNEFNPDDNTVTMEMLVETMAKEFPEFMLAIAEENWIRGYHQGLSDVDAGKELVEEFGEVGSD